MKGFIEVTQKSNCFKKNLVAVNSICRVIESVDGEVYIVTSESKKAVYGLTVEESYAEVLAKIKEAGKKDFD